MPLPAGVTLDTSTVLFILVNMRLVCSVFLLYGGRTYGTKFTHAKQVFVVQNPVPDLISMNELTFYSTTTTTTNTYSTCTVWCAAVTAAERTWLNS